jgi:hypothetical protein
MVLLSLAAASGVVDAIDGADDSKRSLTSGITTTSATSGVTTAPVDSIPTTLAPVAQPTSQRAQTNALIDSLVVDAPYTQQPYRRAAFDDDWIDADRDCHNTRAEVLMAETTTPVTFNPNGCTVNTGSWTDPWSGFTSTSAADFEIDHTIPLANAWRSGAWQWDGTRRVAFANDLTDPDTLNALRGSVNTSKGDRTPDLWKPPLTSSWCHYATAWARIKSSWGLSVIASERTTLLDMAATCG